jgi:hypothetical protein
LGADISTAAPALTSKTRDRLSAIGGRLPEYFRDALWKQIVWQQFGAAIDMLGNAMGACRASRSYGLINPSTRVLVPWVFFLDL